MDFLRAPSYAGKMRLLSLLSLLFLSVAFSACESELPAHGPDLGTRVMKGFRGEGALYVPGEPRPVHPSGYAD
jgi:hypothetical protein